MPRVFVGNFDFEHDLVSGPRQLPREVQLLAADLVSAWVTMADDTDVTWSPTGVPTFDFADLKALGIKLPRFITREADLPRGPDWELVPWGWTNQWLTWGQSHGWTCPAPPLELVKLVNSRVFRCELERELGVELPGAGIIRSGDELAEHVSRHVVGNSAWVLKANFGMAGRQRILGRGSKLEPAVLNWARKRLESSSGIVFEPWLDRFDEAGLQWNIPSDGEPELIGITPLLTDSTGTYRGSRICCESAELAGWQAAVDVTRRVAGRLQSIGYFGPLGIDAMRYRAHDGTLLCRPLQDLNARYTMGRLALGLSRFVPSEREAVWLHDASLVAQSKADGPTVNATQITARSWLVKSAVGIQNKV